MSNQTKHTPGPWTVDMSTDSRSRGYVRCNKKADSYAQGGIAVARVCFSYLDYSELEANARLIASAPELLEALKGILEIGKRDMSNPKYDGYFDTARAAIAKAEGKTP